MEKEIISAREAAEILGIRPEKVRQRIRAGIWTFGVCIPGKKTGRKRDDFDIYTRKLNEFIERGGESN